LQRKICKQKNKKTENKHLMLIQMLVPNLVRKLRNNKWANNNHNLICPIKLLMKVSQFLHHSIILKQLTNQVKTKKVEWVAWKTVIWLKIIQLLKVLKLEKNKPRFLGLMTVICPMRMKILECSLKVNLKILDKKEKKIWREKQRNNNLAMMMTMKMNDSWCLS